jgi:hypothetical protein
MFSFNSQMTNTDGKKEYTIQITTDNYEQFKFIQDCARECVDGKHTEGVLSTYQQLIEKNYDWSKSDSTDTLTYIPDPCKHCPNHPSNGGSGICSCTLGLTTVTSCTNSTSTEG